MVTLLGEDAYKAAKHQTSEKLKPMKEAFIALTKKSNNSKKTRDTKPTSK